MNELASAHKNLTAKKPINHSEVQKTDFHINEEIFRHVNQPYTGTHQKNAGDLQTSQNERFPQPNHKIQEKQIEDSRILSMGQQDLGNQQKNSAQGKHTLEEAKIEQKINLIEGSQTQNIQYLQQDQQPQILENLGMGKIKNEKNVKLNNGANQNAFKTSDNRQPTSIVLSTSINPQIQKSIVAVELTQYQQEVLVKNNGVIEPNQSTVPTHFKSTDIDFSQQPQTKSAEILQD